MTIKLKDVIFFVVGGLLAGLCVYLIMPHKKSEPTQSGVFPVIYDKIKDKQSGIDDLEKNKKAVSEYANQLQKAYDDMSKITIPVIDKSAGDESLLNTASSLKNTISQVFQMTILPSDTYNPNSGSKNNIYNQLNRVAQNLNDDFNYRYEALWALPDSGLMTMTPQLKKFLDTSAIRAANKDMMRSIQLQIDKVNNIGNGISDDEQALKNDIKNLQDSLEDVEKSNRDRMLIYVVIPLFCAVVIMLLAVPALYRNDEFIIKAFFEKDILLQVFAIFILVVTILLLAIGGKIESQTIGTLLGGISVYVLQRALGGDARQSGDKSTNNNPPPNAQNQAGGNQAANNE
jgi:gas vesicle protein